MTRQRNSSFPTLFQQIFAPFCVLMTNPYIFLFFHFFASKIQALLITTEHRLQTESKENFCLMIVYSHKTLFQPQASNAKKQTFSNHFHRKLILYILTVI